MATQCVFDNGALWRRSMIVGFSRHSLPRHIKRWMSACAIGLVLLVMTATRAEAWPPGNQTPPMGWEPWNIDHCESKYRWDAEFYKKLADFFVTSGLRDLGYKYLTIECGDHYRDKDGHIQPNLQKFPEGLRAMTDYLHQKGLKARTYTDAGLGKCCCFEGTGSRGHYEDDAQRWVAFGFDAVKIDWCGGFDEHLDPKKQYNEFAAAIRKVAPQFIIEICDQGRGDPWLWGREAGTFWRTSDDIDSGTIGGNWSLLMRNLNDNRHPDERYVGPGKGWNYADMLLAGHPGGLTEDEQRTQFSMWAIMASPLFLGNDVFNMDQYTRQTVMNKEVIAIDQDPLGAQGDVAKEFENGKLQVWAKPLQNGSKAVALLNKDTTSRKMTVNWSDLGISGPWRVRNLWEHVNKGKCTGRYTVEVPSHAAVLLKLSFDN